MKTFTAYVEWDPETRLYVGIMQGIVGALTQAATLNDLRINLKEVWSYAWTNTRDLRRTCLGLLDYNRLRFRYDTFTHHGFQVVSSITSG